MDKLSKLLTIKDKRELREFTKEEKLLEHYYKKWIDCHMKRSIVKWFGMRD